jgi:hypothetical protein
MAAEFSDTGDPEASDEMLDIEQASDGRLRSAMLADGQPSFPWWLPLPGIALAVLWAAYRGVSAEDGAGSVFLEELLWPGAAIFILTTITSYFGWRLDLD